VDPYFLPGVCSSVYKDYILNILGNAANRPVYAACASDVRIPAYSYLNRADVRQVLHVPADTAPWAFCTSINYDTPTLAVSMNATLIALSGRGLRFTVTQGD
jgi:hypothetical protein